MKRPRERFSSYTAQTHPRLFITKQNFICCVFREFIVNLEMASCNFCKANPEDQLKNCVCGKASYCSKDCQAKDWKTHKPSCPPFIIRESPGKGRGLFATRKIKEGQIILDEYSILFSHSWKE